MVLLRAIESVKKKQKNSELDGKKSWFFVIGIFFLSPKPYTGNFFFKKWKKTQNYKPPSDVC